MLYAVIIILMRLVDNCYLELFLYFEQIITETSKSVIIMKVNFFNRWHGSKYVRLNNARDEAWCSSPNDINPYIKVNIFRYFKNTLHNSNFTGNLK